jgi:hypothetical protein
VARLPARLEKGRPGVPFRVLLAATSIWLLCGLSFPKANLRVPQPVVPVYKFVDARDPKLAKSAAESLMIGSCAYGAVRIGQRDIAPDLAVQLHAMLATRFGERLRGRNVTLSAFSLHVNNAAKLRAGAASMYRGMVPALLNDTKKIGCSGDDTRGGYVLGEVPEGASPFIVAVHVVVDGEPYRGRSIAIALGRMQALEGTPQADGNGQVQLSPRDDIYQRGIDEALGRLGDAIEAGLSAAAVDTRASVADHSLAPVHATSSSEDSVLSPPP